MKAARRIGKIGFVDVEYVQDFAKEVNKRILLFAGYDNYIRR